MSINLTDPTPDEDDAFPTPYKELLEPTAPSPKAIRAWALEQGLHVGKRGRIPGDVELAYMQARQS